eukprot:ANDGO_05245.mRNA.1 hypothetical protein PHYSODRAFT_352787
MSKKPAKAPEPPPPPPEPVLPPVPTIDPAILAEKKAAVESQNSGNFDRDSDILQFIFPHNLAHPRSGARLFVYGRYGPLTNGGIAGGSKRSHVLSDFELNALIEDEERDFVNAVYHAQGRSRPVDTGQVHPDIELALVYSRQEVQDILDAARGSFHQLQRVIVKNRQKRIAMFQKSVVDFRRIREEKVLRRTLSDIRNGTITIPHTRSLVEDVAGTFEETHRQLARSSHAIQTIGEHSVEVTQNVKLLRPEEKNKLYAGEWRK